MNLRKFLSFFFLKDDTPPFKMYGLINGLRFDYLVRVVDV